MTKQLDIPTLEQSIHLCNAYSRDNEKFNPEERDGWLTQAETLREYLVQLEAIQFSSNLDFKVEAANKKLTDISQKLQNTQNLLNSYNDSIEELQALAGILGDLVNLATPVA